MSQISLSIFILGITYQIFPSSCSQKDCVINWSSSLPTHFPLIYDKSGIIYPRKIGSRNDWKITVKSNHELSVGCGKDNLLKEYETDEVKITCTNSRLIVSNRALNFLKLGCARHITEEVTTTGTCLEKYTAVDVQFSSKSSKFPLINLCFDETSENTLYTHHYVIGAGLNPYEVSNKRPSFKESIFYKDISANTAYSQRSQLAQVSKLVGSATLGKKYITKTKSLYFARGHFAPDGDFLHVYEQNATYYYMNVCPQWQAINNGNWKALEFAIRTYAKVKNTDLEIWTGGKDILKLQDVNNKPVDIHLAENNRIPVPEILWKIIKDPIRKASVAIFMINNPHLTKMTSKLQLCEDICSKISWVTWDISNIHKGYTYCCETKSVAEILPFIPNLHTLTIMS